MGKKKAATKKAPARKATATGRSREVLASLMENQNTTFGTNRAVILSPGVTPIVGVPLPSLSMEWLLDCNVWPLERFGQLVGPPGVGKSALLWEVMRWFVSFSQGIGQYIEVESKFSLQQAMALMGADYGQVMVQQADNVQESQAMATLFMQNLTDEMSKRGGAIYPVLQGIDSLTGKSGEGGQTKVLEGGHGNKAFPEEASVITSWLKGVSHMYRGLPIAMIGVNHLKDAVATTGMGAGAKRYPGGVHLNFQETFELRLSRARDGKSTILKGTEIVGFCSTLKCHKSSLGRSGNSLDIECRWLKMRQPDNTVQQRMYWDWHKATTELLTKFGERTQTGREIHDVVDLNATSYRNMKHYWSKKLGIPKDKPATPHEVGRRICEDVEMRKAIRGILGIFTFYEFKPGVPYSVQMVEASKDASARYKASVESAPAVSPSEFGVE